MNAGEKFTCSNDRDKSYKHTYNLTKHMLNECGGKKLFSCYICNKKFTQKITHSSLI